MEVNRRIVVIAAAGATALAAAGAGIAQAVGGDSEENVTGAAAQKARTAALAAAGGGTVLEVERQDGDGAGVYEVAVRRADGSQLKIHLDAQFKPLGSAPDDDSAAHQDEGESDSDD
jgi:hypothetical protein